MTIILDEQITPLAKMAWKICAKPLNTTQRLESWTSTAKVRNHNQQAITSIDNHTLVPRQFLWSRWRQATPGCMERSPRKNVLWMSQTNASKGDIAFLQGTLSFSSHHITSFWTITTSPSDFLSWVTLASIHLVSTKHQKMGEPTIHMNCFHFKEVFFSLTDCFLFWFTEVKTTHPNRTRTSQEKGE